MNFSETEKTYISLTDRNLQFFNTGRRKKLTVQYYVDGGNRATVKWGHVSVAVHLSIQEAHYFIWGFTSGRERK